MEQYIFSESEENEIREVVDKFCKSLNGFSSPMILSALVNTIATISFRRSRSLEEALKNVELIFECARHLFEGNPSIESF